MYFDIHSHILPNVDDGAKSLDEAIAILKLMKKSGIDACIATSHFYPLDIDFETFNEITAQAFCELKVAAENKKLPQIYLGCELLYYKGVGESEIPKSLFLNGSKYLLLELAVGDIHDHLFADLLSLLEKGTVPIIAHIERYFGDRRFKKLLEFVSENKIPVQINALSFLVPQLKKPVTTILNSDIFCVIGTDSHSITERPPLMKEAMLSVRDNFGKEKRAQLVKNANRLYKEIIGENSDK